MTTAISTPDTAPDESAGHRPARPLRVGPLRVWPPVVLAPMAGVTNAAFRRLCREHGAGLYVSEMVTSRALVERNAETLRMVSFAADEHPRSAQLYGVDPAVVGEAVAMLVEEQRVDHVDLNFGCPVPKVTRRGGGAALPWRRRLFARIVARAVEAARPSGVPVTVKLRTGIDPDHLTYLDAGLEAQEQGVAAVALHGRTAAQLYSGHADWEAIARLKRALDVPVLGNGDIWTGADAVRMVERTGCDGVVVGRGCLGRPWLFADLAAAFEGRRTPEPPRLGQVARVMSRHARLLCEELGEARGVRDMRKHMAWYLKGFSVRHEIRVGLSLVDGLARLDELLAQLDADQPYPPAIAGQPRGRTSPARRVVLPEGWLDNRDDEAVPPRAELGASGG